MIKNVTQTNINHSAFAGNKRCFANKEQAQLSFGDYYDSSPSPLQSIKDGIATLTDDVVGFIGINAVLWYLQNFVNGKILSGKINKYFTSKIPDKEKLLELANNMKTAKENGISHVNIKTIAQDGVAFFDHLKNVVVVGKNEHSALFHELGHAIQENNTRFFKWLQRGRGHYTFLALALYTLMAQRQKSHA
ncbi:MAG: hypothetical protein PHC64_03340, partial [Candidatus Gastranaerophilales bacterium]|nr:hypothetical protein [Candidatus Gastranaerophilales bacterium]